MRAISGRNVNTLFTIGMRELTTSGLREDSRNGPVIVYPEPVCSTYDQPCERVLFSRARRANPFFHLFESFWMLAGRDDAAFLDRYVSDFGARFAEGNGELHGAYGNRWKNWQGKYYGGFDQLDWAVDLLLRDPGSRRAVIQMYDPNYDSTLPTSPIIPRDIPCNTTIYLRLRSDGSYQNPPDPVLDLTVCCRSNDAIWGAFGANAVHFSVLLEYLAFRLDARVGRLHQLSNNLHVYDATRHLYDPEEGSPDLYATGKVAARSLFSGALQGAFEIELGQWMEDPSNRGDYPYDSPVFGELLTPMSRVHDAIKAKDWLEAERLTDFVLHTDWSMAAYRWIETRPGHVGFV